MLTSPRQPVQPPPMRVYGRPPRAKPARWRRVRRIALAAAALVLIPVLVSYAKAVTESSNSTLGIRTVEWLRDNGARALVTKVENVYYSLTAPPKGGAALRRLPGQAGALSATTPARHVAVVRQPHYEPPNIKPLVPAALPGEGVWHATFAGGGSQPPVLITSFRPDPADYPTVVAGVAWIDHTRTSTMLYPGRLEPAVALPSRGPMEVPIALRSRLVATFNSGFKLSDSGGGFAYDGHTYEPLENGMATLIRYRNGRLDLVAWHGGPIAGPDAVYARQNLPLIVDHGQPNPNLSDGPEWGATLGNRALVWRSAVGIDRHGNLLYGAGPAQGLHSLAALMIHAGAVRAMELDINTYWTTFVSYRFPGAGDPANLLESMDRSPQRYLTPDDRDFFAVYVR